MEENGGGEGEVSLEYTPTWVAAAICFVIVFLSLCVQRALHKFGRWLKHKQQFTLFNALEKLQEELMLLGFISLLLTVTQGFISHICIPAHVASHMLHCKRNRPRAGGAPHGRRLLSSPDFPLHCARKGKIPLLSLEALHELHIFIFVLAVVHVAFCAITMVLGGAKIRKWKQWENKIKDALRSDPAATHADHHHAFFTRRASGWWRGTKVFSWTVSFFRQFHGFSMCDYVALRDGYIAKHCPGNKSFDFYGYMVRTLEEDFRKIVGISWYLWVFVVIFMLLNVGGWHTYFWLSFLPLILLAVVGTKLEHIITELAEEVQNGWRGTAVEPSDKHFWFGRPDILLYLIHFILFQNSFEIAFFFWILCTYGMDSCIMEKLGYIIPRLIMGVMVEVLCSYFTLPLYAIVSQMGSRLKPTVFDPVTKELVEDWVHNPQPISTTSPQDRPATGG